MVPIDQIAEASVNDFSGSVPPGEDAVMLDAQLIQPRLACFMQVQAKGLHKHASTGFFRDEHRQPGGAPAIVSP
jgi:hypothetical protein